MSYSRYRAKGDAPQEVFIVSNGSTHRLYSTLAAARGVRTRENNPTYGRKTNAFKIYRLKVDNLEEVD